MIDTGDACYSSVTTSSWGEDGIATLEATGRNVQAALEAGLGAVLRLALGNTSPALGLTHSAPVRGEGDDLSELFAEMAEDLLDQVAFFGDGLHEIIVDGVLRRDEGGYVAWGYATGTFEATAAVVPPRLVDSPTASEEGNRVTIRASLRRS